MFQIVNLQILFPIVTYRSKENRCGLFTVSFLIHRLVSLSYNSIYKEVERIVSRLTLVARNECHLMRT